VDVAKAKALAASLLGKGPGPKDHNSVSDKTAAAQPPAAIPAAGPASIDISRVEVQKTEQDKIAGIMIGFKANTVIGAPDWYDFAMAKTLTGGYTYPTGYLFETLRGKGLVYVVESQNSAGRDAKLPGTFLVFAGCSPEKVNEVVDLCLENIARLQGDDNDINPIWYNRSKDLIAVADAMEHETPAAQASTAAINELYGLGYGWQDQFADKIRSVPMVAVQGLARQRLRECVVTISTPAPELVKVKAGLRKYESFPPVDLTPRGVQHDTGAAGAK
jgi:predicted Zn-dependent peptidase